MENLIAMDLYRDEMIETLIRILRIESVKDTPEPNRPYGKGLFDALMFMMSTAEDMDLDCVNLFGHLGYIDYGEGDDIVAVLTHIDVVPAGEGWTYPPFDGTIADGKIYGRGSIDNKGPAIASLFALKALSDNGVLLKKKVRLIFGCDEETTWTDMDYYKQHKTLPSVAFSPDANYPVINAEKGVLHLSFKKPNTAPTGEGMAIRSFECGKRPNIVPNAAECVLDADMAAVKAAADRFNAGCAYPLSVESAGSGVRIKAGGLASHGSLPEDGFNAGMNLAVFLSELPLSQNAAEESVRMMVRLVGLNHNGEGTDLSLSDEVSGKLTFNVGRIHMDENRIEWLVDIRYPVTFEQADILSRVESVFGGFFDIATDHAIRAIHVPEDSELVTKLKEAYTEVTGEEAYCIAIGGATYARAFDNAVSFGALFPGEEHVEHGPDEFIRIETLIKCSQITANAIIKLAGGE